MKDIDQVRRENMGLLEREAGGAVAAAARAGMSQAQWSNLKNGAADSKTGKPRGMRKETARQIEKKFGKPEGWLDYADLVEPAPKQAAVDKGREQLLKAWAVAGTHARAEATAWARAVLAANKDASEK